MKFNILNEQEIRNILLDFKSSIDKGYPELVTPLAYYTRVDGERILAYSSFSDMGNFYFVGNTYVMPESRGKGVYTSLLTNRIYQVAKQGGKVVNSYEEVADIMSEDIYTSLSKLPMYIYR